MRLAVRAAVAGCHWRALTLTVPVQVRVSRIMHWKNTATKLRLPVHAPTRSPPLAVAVITNNFKLNLNLVPRIAGLSESEPRGQKPQG